MICLVTLLKSRRLSNRLYKIRITTPHVLIYIMIVYVSIYPETNL